MPDNPYLVVGHRSRNREIPSNQRTESVAFTNPFPHDSQKEKKEREGEESKTEQFGLFIIYQQNNFTFLQFLL